MVISIFVALVFMVRFVLNSSKVFVDNEIEIYPMLVEWGLERDGSLRINEPYFLNTDLELIAESQDSTLLVSNLNIVEIASLKDLEKPYLIWKHAESDTIQVLKDNVLLKFKLESN